MDGIGNRYSNIYRLLPPFFVPSTFNLLTRKSNITSSIRITCQPTIVFVAGKDGQGKHIISVSKAKHEHGQGGSKAMCEQSQQKQIGIFFYIFLFKSTNHKEKHLRLNQSLKSLLIQIKVPNCCFL